MLSAKKIPPGKTGQIEARINTAGMSGAVEKLITITTNDSRNATVSLTIKAVIEPEVAVSEPAIFFGTVPVGREVSRDIFLTIPAAKKIKILSAASQDPNVAAKLEEMPGSSGKKYKLTVTRKANAKPGNHYGQIIVKTDSRLSPEVVIYENGTVTAARK